jgi:hypothetical protein
MRGKFLHGIGAIILAVAMFSGVAMLGATTAQARRRVVIVPRVYVGRGPHYRHWHRNHWRYRGW